MKKEGFMASADEEKKKDTDLCSSWKKNGDGQRKKGGNTMFGAKKEKTP